MIGKIVVIGSSNVDFIMKMAQLPRRGETITDAVFLQTFGGKGANQALAAARAGGRVSFVNCVGDDSYGTAIKENMSSAGIDTRFVFQEREVASGTALVMIGEGGDNYLSVAPGANYALTPAHIDQATALLSESALVMLQCEIPPDTLAHVFEVAGKLERPLMLNLAPARPIPTWALPLLTYLIVNESEASFLCDCPVDSLAQAAQAAEQLRLLGPRVVVVTLGDVGAYVCCDKGTFHVPAFAVQGVDSTAAGDVFCGALAVTLVEGATLPHALRFASAAAAICVTRLGAQPSIPLREEIDLLLERGSLAEST